MRALLAEYAPLQPVPLCPQLRAHNADTLVDIWEAAERIAEQPLAAPFWAYPWPAGSALARVLLDAPDLVSGKRVLDVGAGGGVASLGAARAGAATVVANDIDEWALLVTRLAAAAQDLEVSTLAEDLTRRPRGADDFDVVLCADLAYERRETPRQRALLERAQRRGALVLVADAGRAYFSSDGMEPLASFTIDTPADLEGVGQRTATVYRLL